MGGRSALQLLLELGDFPLQFHDISSSVAASSPSWRPVAASVSVAAAVAAVAVVSVALVDERKRNVRKLSHV